MSDIGLIMNALLGVLLLGALAMGWRLEQRLKTLRASHQSFTRAVEDLDRAAGRAEQGLADLRAATDEAADSLAGRIERAAHLASRLEALTAEASKVETRLAAAPRAATPLHAAAASERPTPARESAFARFAERYGARGAAPSPSTLAEAAARNDLILEDDPEPAPRTATFASPGRGVAPDVAARLDRLRALVRRVEAPPHRSATRLEDDLFEAPKRAAGGLR